MLTDWIHWLSSQHLEDIIVLFFGLLLLDAPRYALGRVVVVLSELAVEIGNRIRGRCVTPKFTHCPSACAVLAGYNESETIGATLDSLWGSYPRLEIIVVDDGSDDGMAQVARRFAADHVGVTVLGRPHRGGKSSALNLALPYTRAEIVVSVDADSHLGPNAIWEIVQPFQNPQVGVVSGTVLARNPFTNLATWLQAYEYLHSILVGRLISARLGILSIASGAFAAMRREAMDRVMGWDVGPPEDLDLTMRIRKCGYEVDHVLYAQCFTEVPTTWTALWKQRIRWDQSGVIRNHCRKHVDMLCFWSANFRWGNFWMVVDALLFNVVFAYAFLGFAIWYCVDPPDHFGHFLISLYFLALGFEFLHVLTGFFYTLSPSRDAQICAIMPLAPFYQLFLCAVRIVATTRELFWRKSFEDNYVPERVREATWRW